MNYRLDDCGLIPKRGKRFFSSHRIQIDFWPTQPPIQWVLGAFSSGVKWLGYKDGHSPPSNVEVKNGGAILPLPPYIFMVWCLIN
jgi:hypothetical protein